MSEKESAEEDGVRLPAILGIRPGAYLAVLYALIILGVVFFTLFFPGLSGPGSVAAVSCEPEGAAFYVDGIYMGAAPCKIFVPKGRHTLTLSLPGFTPFVREEEFRGRLFASSIFPLVHPVRAVLESPAPAAVFASHAADFAAWTFAGEPTAAYQIPMSLSEGAYRAARPGAAELREEMNGIIEASARFAVTRASLRDLARAKALSDNGGLAPSPVSLLRSAEESLAWLAKYPQGREWLGRVLPGLTPWQGESAEGAEDTAFATPGLTETAGAASLNGQGEAARISIEDLPFIRVGEVSEGRSGDFWFCGAPVPQGLFTRFLAENPRWIGPSYGAGENAPAAGVSWYAAEAFCLWFSARLPAAMADYEARLPAEAEWEAAAGSEGSPRVPPELLRNGGLWEWCADPFAPLLLPADPRAIEAVGSPERSLRRITADSQGQTIQTERASLPPDLSSPIISFRPVIVRKTAGD
ncbi:MAG: SUMF1/EgtB/PvdO family nonheme iron enzyme [Treponema sp.]|jgi:hypothetical protein|nr:SUMF1/EgtB/PvdO family nonheme iron enzyme [Treponema sp.]